MDSDGPAWSEDVGQADWIAGRLTPWADRGLAVTAVVPGGFESYARLLHPAAQVTAAQFTAAGDDAADRSGDRMVRWAEVAAWSGLPLHRTAQWHSVALPPSARPGPPPFSQGPAEGTLDCDDAAALAGILRAWTSTPQDCWFCVWDGFGWGASTSLSSVCPAAADPPGTAPAGNAVPAIAPPETAPPASTMAGRRADPVPGPVRNGPRVRLPDRDYLLYRGPAEAVTATARLSGTGQTANLWWPADRAWCVATEIDLEYSYVGGPAGLIEALGADGRIEALPARADDRASLVLEDWVAGWVAALTDTLLTTGEAALSTALGTVRARLRRPRWPADGSLITETDTGRGSRSSGGNRIRPGEPGEMRRDIAFALTNAILVLAHG